MGTRGRPRRAPPEMSLPVMTGRSDAPRRKSPGRERANGDGHQPAGRVVCRPLLSTQDTTDPGVAEHLDGALAPGRGPRRPKRHPPAASPAILGDPRPRARSRRGTRAPLGRAACDRDAVVDHVRPDSTLPFESPASAAPDWLHGAERLRRPPRLARGRGGCPYGGKGFEGRRNRRPIGASARPRPLPSRCQEFSLVADQIVRPGADPLPGSQTPKPRVLSGGHAVHDQLDRVRYRAQGGGRSDFHALAGMPADSFVEQARSSWRYGRAESARRLGSDLLGSSAHAGRAPRAAQPGRWCAGRRRRSCGSPLSRRPRTRTRTPPPPASMLTRSREPFRGMPPPPRTRHAW